jgi:hypothetical protein
MFLILYYICSKGLVFSPDNIVLKHEFINW